MVSSRGEEIQCRLQTTARLGDALGHVGCGILTS